MSRLRRLRNLLAVAALGALGFAVPSPFAAPAPLERAFSGFELITPAAAATEIEPRPAALEEPAARGRIVVLVTIDGVRHRELFEGVDPRLAAAKGLPREEVVGPEQLMPELTRLVDLGVALGHDEAPMRARGPVFKSTPGYLEIFRGKSHPRCTFNDCSVPPGPALLDEAAATGELGSVVLLTSWAPIARAAIADPSRIVSSTGRSAGDHQRVLRADRAAAVALHQGNLAGAAPGQADFRKDKYTATLAERVIATRTPRLLVVGLGEADEYGHLGLYRLHLRALSESDAAIGRLWRALEARRLQGWETALVVTTDHGRDEHCRDHGGDAASARVWLVAAGSLIRRAGRLSTGATHGLVDVAPTLRVLLDLPAQPSDGRPLTELLAR